MSAEQTGDFGLADKTAERRRGEFFLGDFPTVVAEVVPQRAHFEAGLDVYLEPLVEVLDGVAIVLARGADVERRAVGDEVFAFAKDVVLYRETVLFFGVIVHNQGRCYWHYNDTQGGIIARAGKNFHVCREKSVYLHLPCVCMRVMQMAGDETTSIS